MLRREQDDINPHFLGVSQATAHRRHTIQQQQQHNSARAPNSGLRDTHGAVVFVYLPMCAVFTTRIDTTFSTYGFNTKHTSSNHPVMYAILGVNRKA